MNTIGFVFGGRRETVELQMPFVHRILDQHPDLQWHIWNLARNPQDADYLNSLATDRVRVRNDFYGHPDGFNRVFMHYSHPQYARYRFVKVDDDVVFLQTGRFADLLDAISDDYVVSADVVNNGACTASDPDFPYDRLLSNIPLLDVHMSARYAKAVHAYCAQHFDRLLNQPLRLVPTDDWLSINVIGFTHPTMADIGSKVGRLGPLHIAGRSYLPSNTLGDEGMVNTLPRRILKGFLAVHLQFGGQDLHDKEWRLLRKQYRALGEVYLDDQRSARHTVA